MKDFDNKKIEANSIDLQNIIEVHDENTFMKIVEDNLDKYIIHNEEYDEDLECLTDEDDPENEDEYEDSIDEFDDMDDDLNKTQDFYNNICPELVKSKLNIIKKYKNENQIYNDKIAEIDNKGYEELMKFYDKNSNKNGKVKLKDNYIIIIDGIAYMYKEPTIILKQLDEIKEKYIKLKENAENFKPKKDKWEVRQEIRDIEEKIQNKVNKYYQSKNVKEKVIEELEKICCNEEFMNLSIKTARKQWFDVQDLPDILLFCDKYYLVSLLDFVYNKHKNEYKKNNKN